VWVPSYQFRDNVIDGVGDFESPGLESDLRLKDALEYDVAELALELGDVAAIDRFDGFVRFFEQKGPQCLGRLLAIPRTSARRSQDVHDSHEASECASRAPFACGRSSLPARHARYVTFVVRARAFPWHRNVPWRANDWLRL